VNQTYGRSDLHANQLAAKLEENPKIGQKPVKPTVVPITLVKPNITFSVFL
jgi:hypothetical protein